MSHSTELAPSKLKWIGGVAICLVLFLIWIEGGFTSKTPPGTQKENTPISERQTIAVFRQSADGPISWPARVEPLKTIQIAPKFSGRIVEILVTAGMSVSRGQPLVRFENSEFKARLSQAKAQLTAAEAGSARANADAIRIRNLFGKEAATRQSLDAATAEERQRHAQVQEAKATVAQMESYVAESTLIAPYDGIVERRLQEPGDMVMSGQPVLSFLQTPVLRIEASLPSSCAQGIRVGDSMTATSPHLAQDLTAIVEEKEPASDRQSQTQTIKARLQISPETTLIPGSFVWLQQSCGSESLMLIPADSIKRIGQIEIVSILSNGQPVIRHIRTGRTFGEAVEVLSGLNEGDQIFVGAHP